MHRLGLLLLSIRRLLGISILSAILVVLRYILKTPQPLESMLPGESHLFKWTHGHVFYKTLGVLDAPPLVVVHTPEIGGSSYEFRALVEQLAQYYHIYALDLLGFGLSDRPDIYYTGETYTTLCQDFLTHIVQQPAILVASELSCNYAIAVASTQPELCERLVLLSPSTLFKDGERQESVIQQPFVGLFVYALLTMRVILRGVVARQKQERVVSERELDYTYASSHQLGAQHAAIAFLSGRLLLDASCFRETLRTPTLLLWGTNASSADESIAEFYAANDAVQELLIQGAGLRPHQEQPAEVAAQFLQWGMPTTEHVEGMAGFSSRDDITAVQEEETRTQDTFVHDSEAQDIGLAVPSYTKEYENISTKENMMADEKVEAYCVKCKEKRIMKDPTDTVTKNGRSAKTGTCPVCGTKLFRFVAS